MRRRGYGMRRRGLRRVKNVHHFKESFRLSNILVNANSQNSGVLTCSLANLTNYGSFQKLYDLYKITGVKFKFLYRANSADTVGSTASTGIPTLYTAPNRDPEVPAPTSIVDILNDDGIKIHRCDGLVGRGGIYVKAPKPDMKSQVVDAGGFPIGKVIQQWQLGVGASKQYWLCTGGNSQTLDQSDVKHYGLRWFLDNTFCVSEQIVEVYATLYFSMKEQD